MLDGLLWHRSEEYEETIEAGTYANGCVEKQVFAEVVAALSAFTALLYMIPFFMKIPFLFAWDILLFFLWIVIFGIFGNVCLLSFRFSFLNCLTARHEILNVVLTFRYRCTSKKTPKATLEFSA